MVHMSVLIMVEYTILLILLKMVKEVIWDLVQMILSKCNTIIKWSYSQSEILLRTLKRYLNSINRSLMNFISVFQHIQSIHNFKLLNDHNLNNIFDRLFIITSHYLYYI